MIRLPVEVARPLGRLDVAAGVTEVTGFQVDSRRIEPGDLFVAVGRGAEFAQDALARGAAATLVPDEAFAALAALAAAVRRRSTARVVGITGTAGKTSTKDILAALCRPHARTVAAEEGFNNEIGLPLTLAQMEDDTEVVIAEMGMRGLGQIRELCKVAQPHVGVITSIGPVHLELLRTVDNVARAKAEVVDALPAGGTAVVPVEAPELAPFLGRADVEYVRFGRGGDVRAERFEPPLLLADVGGERVELEVPFTARHQAENALAALGAYRALGLPLDRAWEGARTIAFSRWRGEESELPGGGMLINDAYNANPASMRAALEHLVERAAGRRAVAVLGEMAELGADSARYHREAGAAARSLGVGLVVSVGGDLAHEYGADEHAETAGDAVVLLRGLLQPGDVVLVKASRAAALERVAEGLVGARA